MSEPAPLLLAQGNTSDYGMLLFFILGTIAVVATIAGIMASIAARKKSKGELQEFARRIGGRIEEGEVWGLPMVRFQHQGIEALFKFSSHSDGDSTSYRTHFSIHWPKLVLRCEIYPESLLTGLRRLLGMQDIQIGSPRFDDAFVITGNDETAIKQFLTPAVQSLLLEISRCQTGTALRTCDLHLVISGGLLTLTKEGLITNADVLAPLCRQFLRLFDEAASMSDSGIKFLETRPPPDQVAPHCTVCGESLTSDLVACRGCRTLHHRECWQYFGGCATYGCGGKLHQEPREQPRKSA
jgi:hypothetical protein